MATRRGFMQATAGLISSFFMPDVALAAMARQSGKVVEDQPLLLHQLSQLHKRYSKPLENMTPQEIETAARGCSLNLWPFCDTDESYSRYDFLRPVTQRGYTYATDGRVLVRTDRPGSAKDIDEEASLPEMTDWLPWELFPDANWKKWPIGRDWENPGNFHNRGPCPYCDGRGVVGDGIKECFECDEDGEVFGAYYSYGDDFGCNQVCRNCRGTKWYGGKDCTNCLGRGTSGDCRVICNQHYSPELCKRIEASGAGLIEFYDVDHLPRPVRYEDKGLGETMPLLLRFNEGEALGLVMPLRKD